MGRIVPVQEIADGMITAEPIINSFGQTLLPAGATMKSSHINLLKTWNIMSVNVKSDDSDEEFKISEELRNLAFERLSQRVFWQPRNAFEQDLFEVGVLNAAYIITNRDNPF